MSQTAYSSLKAAWHNDKINRMRSGGLVVPPQVQLIISDLCNHDCHFCAYRMSGGFSTEQFAGPNGEKNPKRMISKAKCFEILEDCAAVGVKAIQFTGGGEPTVHPDHMEIFDHALGLGLECGLVSNGALLRPGWQGILPRFKWVRISVDAGRPETYAKVRSIKESAYSRTLDNIRRLREQIDHQGSDCLLGAGYVVTRENCTEIVEGCLALADAGVPYVRISAMFSDIGSNYYDGIFPEIKNAIAEARLTLRGSGTEIVDLFGDRVEDLEQGPPDYTFCGYQQFNVYIGGNLKIYRCCTTSYTAHGEVGDLSDQSFAQWLDQRGPKYHGFDARSCKTCQFNDKNRTINYLVDREPVHVNFV